MLSVLLYFQLILLPVFGAVDEPLSSCIMVHFQQVLSIFLNDSSYVSLLRWRGIFYWFLAFIQGSIHHPNFAEHVSSQLIYSEIDFISLVVCTAITHGHSLYSF